MWIRVENLRIRFLSVVLPVVVYFMEFCCILYFKVVQPPFCDLCGSGRFSALLQEKRRFGLILPAVWGILTL